MGTSFIEARTWTNAPDFGFAVFRLLRDDKFISPPGPESPGGKVTITDKPGFWPLENMPDWAEPGKRARIEVPDSLVPDGAAIEVAFVRNAGDLIPSGAIDYLVPSAQLGIPIIAIQRVN